MFGIEFLRWLFSSPFSHSRKEISYEHDGTIDWHCEACRREGAWHFKQLVTRTEVPKVADYEALLTEAEVEHAMTGCRGRLVYDCGSRHRVVKHERII